METIGPADPKAGTRELIYKAGTAITGLAGVAVLLFGLNKGVEVGIDQIVSGVLLIFGAGPQALAASKTAEQRRNGTFEAAPTAPALNAVESIKVVADAYTELTGAVAAGADLVRGAMNVLPGVGAIAGGANSLAQQVLDLTRQRDAELSQRSQQPPLA